MIENLNTDFARHVAARLAELTAKHEVPGANLAVSHRGSIVAKAAAGFAHLGAGIEATTDTVFQIGSITKVWTATVAMQLVDEGTLDLDAPIVSMLPDLRLATDELTDQVSTRHLLTHTSGIDGDFLADTGRGDDALEKFVALLKDVAANHPLGATMSYSNAGYVLLGRLLEVLTGVRWDRLMRERLFAPLGLTHTGTLPEEALLHPAAMGYAGQPPAPVPAWGLMRSLGPAGLITSTPSDVLAFATLHLDGGVTGDGTRILSVQSAAAMREPQVDVPDPWLLAKQWGLGWFLDEWDGTPVFGHDGGTPGQAAFLRVLPEHDLAICLLTNGGSSWLLFQDVLRELTAELAGVTAPVPPAPSADPLPFNPADFVGRYERAGVRLDVTDRDGALFMTMQASGTLGKVVGDKPQETELYPFRENAFVTSQPAVPGVWVPVVFYNLGSGERYLHLGARATPKVA